MAAFVFVSITVDAFERAQVLHVQIGAAAFRVATVPFCQFQGHDLVHARIDVSSQTIACALFLGIDREGDNDKT